ncbi:C-type lectin domain family 4 member M-like isoform X2 [Xiphophorus hellerii]|uniref:C-type lectin domain family 4 member M-like isoform X2 n=1 Tax=Xiphophorus hellerii TaxID=8084 RepID=UPI0013B45B43|nr:C-type lectin domain family 4 member M-like isoform X2 [Xiphophorus hellerii]
MSHLHSLQSLSQCWVSFHTLVASSVNCLGCELVYFIFVHSYQRKKKKTTQEKHAITWHDDTSQTIELKGQMAANESANGSLRTAEDFKTSACGAIWGAAQEEDPAFRNKQTENLQQCQEECQDLKMMLHLATQDSRCRLCPEGWLWWRRHCYFFSVGLQEDRRWNESAEFCQEHNSSLVVIKDDAEMDFLQGVMCNATKFPFLWVGLTDSQQEGRWLWLNGKDVQDPLAVQWDNDDRDCADLRGGGTLFAADCEEYGPWACKRES